MLFRSETEAVIAAPQAATDARGAAILAALGGSGNVRSVDACTTRLRLVVTDLAPVDEAGLRGLGARGVLKLDNGGLQVVFGPVADQIAGEVRAAIAGGPVVVPAAPAVDAAAIARALGAGNIRAVQARGTRLLVELADVSKIDLAALEQGGVLATVVPGDGARPVHLIAGGATAKLAEALQPVR